MEVDEETLSRWRAIPDIPFRDELLSSVSVDEVTGQRVIERRTDGRCRHLQKDGLCRIQNRLGHELLPQTCREYPRVRVEGRIGSLVSLHLSCPAVVNWLVSNAGRKALFHGEEILPATMSPDSRLDLDFDGLCRQLAGFVTNVMNVQSYSLGTRLHVIAEAIAAITRLAGKDELDWEKLARLIPSEPENLRKHFQQVLRRFRKGKIRADRDESGRFFGFVFSCGEGLSADAALFASLGNARLLRHWQQMDLHVPGDRRRLAGLARETLSFQGKVRKRMENVLQDYLVMKFMNHGFPWHPFNNHFVATFLDVIVPYFRIRALLGMYVEVVGVPSDEIVTKAIYGVEKRLSHNMKIFEAIGSNLWVLEIDRFSPAWIDDGAVNLKKHEVFRLSK